MFVNVLHQWHHADKAPESNKKYYEDEKQCEGGFTEDKYS